MTRPWRWRRFAGPALVVSLALNAFFAGAALTDVLHVAMHQHNSQAGLVRFDLRWLDGRLPDDAMNRVAAGVGEGKAGAERRFAHLHELRNNLGVLVAAASPDRKAIDAKLAEIRTELDHLLAETQAATVASVLALPPATRASLGQVPAPQNIAAAPGV